MLSKLFRKNKGRQKVYSSINFLPVWNFYQVIETQDTRYLFKLSDYEVLPETEYRPNDVWAEICEQYFKECVGTKYFQYRTFRTKILELRNKFLILSNAVYALSLVKDEKLIEVIRGLGYRFDDSSEDNYANSLISLSSQLKGLKKAIEIKEKEYEVQFTNKDKQGDLYDIVGALEQWKQFKIDVFSLTVKQFINYQKKYSEEVNRMKAKQFSREVHHGKG